MTLWQNWTTGTDPRNYQGVEFDNSILSIDDLKEGVVLLGIISN